MSFFPDSADEFLRRARHAAVHGSIGHALDLLKASLTRFPDDPRARDVLREAGLDLRFQPDGFRGHGFMVDAAAITNDGTIAATASAGDRTVCLWDVASGEQLALHVRERGRFDEYKAIALDPSGQCLTIASGDGFVERIDTATGLSLTRQAIDPAGFETCALSKNGAWLACAQGTKLEVFDAVTGKRVESIDDPSFFDPTDYKAMMAPFIWDYEYDEDTGPNERQTKIGDIAVSDEGKPTPIFSRPTQKDLVFCPPERSFPSMIARGPEWIAVGNYDGSLTIWSAEGKLLRAIARPSDEMRGNILSVAVADSGAIAIGRYDRSVQVLDAIDAEPSVLLESGTGSIIGVRGVAWSPDGSLLLAITDSGFVRWARRDGNQGTLDENRDHYACLAVAFHPSGEWFATSSCSDHARVWRTKDFTEVHCVEDLGRPPALGFSPSGTAFALAAEDKVYVWPFAGGKCAKKERRLVGTVSSTTIGALAWLDEDRIVTGSADGKLHVWDTRETGPVRVVLDAHSGGIETIAALDARTVLTGARDGMVARWELDAIAEHGSFTHTLRERLRAHA